MGGDAGVSVMVAGAARAHARRSDFSFILFGDEAQLRTELAKFPALKGVADVEHCSDVIAATDKPTQAIRRAKTSSMGRAINAVKTGDAHAAVSGGNTGAMMAMSKLALRTMPGIDRPALAALLPTLGDNDIVMLDLGANTECDVQNLVQFAIMGAAHARVLLDLAAPRVGLLNIGTEELKGTEQIRDAAAILRDADYLRMRFEGFVEGDKIGSGDIDVLVTDGFSGNIALKTAEGTARFVTDLLRRAFTSSLRSKIGFLVSRPAAELLRHHLDPNNHNGAVFLGLNGLVVKSHGNATDKGVANAIRVAGRMVREELTRKIAEDLETVAAHRIESQAAAAK
jgi:glycerol-3-phosphate acyltransferase PlsX